MAHDPGSWQWCKSESFRLGALIGARIGQAPDGSTKTVAVGGRVHECQTWLAVYSIVAAIAADRGPKLQAPAAPPPRPVEQAPAAPPRPIHAAPARSMLAPPRAAPLRSVLAPDVDAPAAVVPVAADFVGLMVCVRGGRWAGRMVHVLAVAQCGRLDCQCDDDGSRVLLPLERLSG